MTELPHAHFSIRPMSFGESWKAAQVARFHNEDLHREQSVGEHSWGVALICLRLWPLRTDLLKAAILHDVPERVLGDIPHPSKSICVDGEKEAAAEEALLGNFDVAYPPENEQDKLRLKIADMLDFVFYVQREVLMGNQLAQNMLVKGSQLVYDRIDLLEPREAKFCRTFVNETLQEFKDNRPRYL